MDRNRSQTAESQQSTESSQSHNEATSEDSVTQPAPCLKSSATFTEILDALKNPVNGLVFISIQQNLPCSTFIAGDAVNWLIARMDGVTTVDQAVQLMQNMHKENLIRHASGDLHKPFLFGFYLFFIVDKDEKTIYEPNGDLQCFENEWMEVEIKPALNWGLSLSNVGLEVPNSFSDRKYGVPHFLCEDINVEYTECDFGGNPYKRMRLETDVSSKSDRVEWGHVRYQTIFMPDQAYELIVEWLTSSGSIVAELLSSWHRKAQACGLQMIPIPHDPLALPYSSKSDPLRGPIFVPLNIKCIEERDRIFKEFREVTYLERLFLLQEAIVQRFGFINCMMDVPTNPNATSREHQYVHATGTIFILISRPASKPRSRVPSVGSKPKRPTGRFSVHADVVPSPHEAYITRHVSGKNKDDYDNTRKMGFLWSWNHMVSRRWRTNQGVDNNFQTRLLKDFRDFCANVDDRLRIFWEESWVTKENAITNFSLRK